MAITGGNKPTNIDRIADLIDLEVEDGQTVEIEEPGTMDNGAAVSFIEDGSAEISFGP